MAVRGGGAAWDARPGRVLIRLPNWLGDVLLARRMLHALHATFPDLPRFAVAPQPLLDLLKPESLFADTFAWPADRAGRSACTRTIRGWRADTAIVLPPSFSSAWFAWRSGARTRIGYAHEARGSFLTDALPRGARGARHLSEEYLVLAERAGAREATTLPDLAPDARAAAAARSLRGEHAALSDGPFVILGPGATYGPAKQWGGDRFAALGRRLVSKGFGIAICGTASEIPQCEAIARDVGAQAVSLAGRTDLAVLAGLCAETAVAVCNDSGLAHLAAAIGAPTVALFGSTSSAWTAPLGRRVKVVQHAPVCAPCFQRTCRIGYVCQRGIGIDAVDAACAEIAA